MKPVTIDINGKKMSIESYLLDMPGRPLPKEPTHFVVADVVNTDLSIKRVTVYFNEFDNWINPEGQFKQQDSKSVGNLIGDHLSFLSLDQAAMAYKFWIVQVATNEVIHQSSFIYRCKNIDY